MQMDEIAFRDARPIDGYGPGFFRIGGEVLRGAQLVLPGGVESWPGYPAAEAAEAAPIDILLVGTGGEIAPVPQDFTTRLEAAGIGVEPMATPAACRTYNMLLAEGRRVGAALLPV